KAAGNSIRFSSAKKKTTPPPCPKIKGGLGHRPKSGPATDRRLGGPLPRQLANRTRADLGAKFFPPKGVYGISPRFQGLFRTPRYVPTCYSPVRHSSRRMRSTCMC
ncbi:Putative uncharacterized protein, partial [Pararhodospirillum photometricum DSM 122]